MARERPDTKWRLVAIANLRIKVFKTSFPLGCPDINLPQSLKDNKCVKTLLEDEKGYIRYDDHKCFFRALAVRRGIKDVEATTAQYCTQWMAAKGLEGSYPGVEMDDFPALEKMFQTNINVLTLEEEEMAVTLYASSSHYP